MRREMCFFTIGDPHETRVFVVGCLARLVALIHYCIFSIVSNCVSGVGNRRSGMKRGRTSFMSKPYGAPVLGRLEKLCEPSNELSRST